MGTKASLTTHPRYDKYCPTAPATLIFHRKRWFTDGAVSELKLSLVPAPVRGSLHTFKYSLFYSRDGRRLVAYDNEAGKGDHRHYGDRQEHYVFTTPEQLIADVLADVHRLRHH